MPNLFNIGVSALISTQRALSTTGHNIANVNTEGYSRQRVTFESRTPDIATFGFLGRGVDASAVERIADQFLVEQLSVAKSNQAQAETYLGLADQVDRLFGNGAMSESIINYFGALQDANGNPTSIPNRQVLLTTSESLVETLHQQEAYLSDLAVNVNQRVQYDVLEINSIAQAIAQSNLDIVRAFGAAQGGLPNDLLDHRDQLVADLSQIVSVTALEQTDGALNIFIGTGQSLVTGAVATTLSTGPNALDPTRLEIFLNAGAAQTKITDFINNGSLGGALDFRDDMLEPARNALGRIAASLAMTVNLQHREGFDLNQALGQDYFTITAPNFNADPANTGTITLTFDQTNIGNLTTADYSLVHDGTDFILTNQSDGTQQTLAGAGPFNVDGLTITIGAAPALGDEYLLQPTKSIARTISLNVTKPEEIALALPVSTSEAIANIGGASISAGEVLDVTDANLLVTTQIIFNDPPTTYQVNGAGPLVPYTSGNNIDLNGWRIQITGSPEPGDTFTVGANLTGVGDNANGLLLSDLQFALILETGTASFEDAFAQIVGDVGAKTLQNQISFEALSILTDNVQAARDSVSGVNLDEEAANLLRFQQAYQAATQLINIANQNFDFLIDAVRG